jgi:RNA polymerase sigma factor (sigma-70 family)
MNDLRDSEPSLEPPVYTPGATTLWNNSWRRIYDQFGQAIIAYARRQGLNDHSAEDVLQEVMTTLIRCQHGQTAGYNPQAGPFQSWLWNVIRNRVRSIRRKDRKEEVASPISQTSVGREASHSLPEVPLPAPDFGMLEEEEWQRALLAAAMRKMQERVKPKNFAIYTALLNQKEPEDLAATFDMKTNAIYAVKHRCEEILLCEARTLRCAWGQLRWEPTS